MVKSWSSFALQPAEEGNLWELFHENSKVGRNTQALSDDEILKRMNELHESLLFRGYPLVAFPESLIPIEMSLGKAISLRSSGREMNRSEISIKELATILYHSYGVTRSKQKGSSPRPPRVVPSAGALYPLELFFCAARVKGLKAGLYHYNPAHTNLRMLSGEINVAKISKSLLQPEIGFSASVLIFLTAIFERCTFKYGDRGYRYALLEAGHVAQNLTLVSTGLELASITLGGFYDREIDSHLGLDGILHSTIYMAAIGRNKPNIPRTL